MTQEPKIAEESRQRLSLETNLERTKRDPEFGTNPRIRKRNRYIRVKLGLFLTGLRKGKITMRKLWNVVACSIAYRLKTRKSAASPYILSLELWNECNAGCVFCRNEKGQIYNINPKQPVLGSISKGKMSPELAMDIIDQIADDLLIAVLYTNGEPLLYKDLPEVVRFATKRKVMTMIATNGLLFNQENARALLEAGIDFIKIQMGGFTQDVYEVQIRYGKVEKLKENIRMLAALRKELKASTSIMLDWITYDYNRHQIPLVQEFCHENGLILNFRPGNPRFLDKEKSLFSGDLPLPNSCDSLWKVMQVNYNGDVLQCCEGVVWSNLKPYATSQAGAKDIRKIWNGSAAQNTRHLMATKGRGSMPVCRQCTRVSVAFKW